MERNLLSSEIPLGGPGDSIRPPLEDLIKRGILSVHPNTICNLRSGRYSGSIIRQLLELSEVLKSNDASWKDELYLKITITGQRLRTNQSTLDSHRYQSKGLTKAIAKELKFKRDSRILWDLILAMREDITLFDLENPKSSLYDSFLATYNEYLDHYLFKGRQMKSTDQTKPGYSQALFDTFERKPSSLTDFYRFTYFQLRNKGRVIGTLLPYELDMFNDFYQRQNLSGNPLTPFDRLVITSTLNRVPDGVLASKIRSKTGLPLSRTTLILHRHVLVGNSP